jgi:hypothetical protein
MNKPYLEHKTALSPAEKLRVAVAVLLDGFDQHRVAALMGVNMGRVNEAVMAVRKAIDPENNERDELAT